MNYIEELETVMLSETGSVDAEQDVLDLLLYLFSLHFEKTGDKSMVEAVDFLTTLHDKQKKNRS